MKQKVSWRINQTARLYQGMLSMCLCSCQRTIAALQYHNFLSLKNYGIRLIDVFKISRKMSLSTSEV